MTTYLKYCKYVLKNEHNIPIRSLLIIGDADTKTKLRAGLLWKIWKDEAKFCTFWYPITRNIDEDISFSGQDIDDEMDRYLEMYGARNM